MFTSRSLSGGLVVGDSIYFLADYTLYRAPRGIARFPDGGRARRLFESVCLYRYDRAADRLDQLAVLLEELPPGLSVATSYFEVDDDVVRFVFASGRGTREDPDAWYAAAWNTATGTVEPVTGETKTGLLGRFTYDGEERLRIGDVTRAVSGVAFDAWRLPSPLDYVAKSDRAYADDLVALRGDQPYRNAIIDAIAQGRIDADPAAIIRRIDERIASRDGVDRDAYELFSRETRERLVALSR
ncbi:MAG: hypothetical protein EA382_00230 [Spirochaetaceae bacterium]|nr:MAG: hypothetical protein EA382_00230 [Spirochaetaceae bacterium]